MISLVWFCESPQCTRKFTKCVPRNQTIRKKIILWIFFVTCVSVSGETGVRGEGAPGGGGVDHLHDCVRVQAGRGPARHRATAGGQAGPGTRGPAQSANRTDISFLRQGELCWPPSLALGI